MDFLQRLGSPEGNDEDTILKCVRDPTSWARDEEEKCLLVHIDTHAHHKRIEINTLQVMECIEKAFPKYTVISCGYAGTDLQGNKDRYYVSIYQGSKNLFQNKNSQI